MSNGIRGAGISVPLAKRCRLCLNDKPMSEFYLRSRMRDGHRSECKACLLARSSEWYLVNRELKPKRRPLTGAERWQRDKKKLDPVKRQARIDVSHAIRRGELTKKPCETCGADKAEAHHDDYSKPLEVRWLCKTHHMEHHWGAAA
jgi:hypothetical protein